jgi:hypothetical protein
VHSNLPGSGHFYKPVIAVFTLTGMKFVVQSPHSDFLAFSQDSMDSPDNKPTQFGPGFWPTFLYYFGSTALVFSLVTAKALGLSVGSSFPQQMGLMGGLVAGLIGGYFNRTVTLSVPIKNRKSFTKKLNEILSQNGYQQKDEVDGVLVYERSNLRKFLSGRVFVQFQDDTVAIASRSVQIKSLKKQIEE